MSILKSLSNRVLIGIFLGQRPKPSLRFGGLMLQEAKSLSAYGIHGRCIHQFRKSILCAYELDRPNEGAGRKKPTERDDHSYKKTWTGEHDKKLLDLLIEHITNGGRNMLDGGADSWSGIVDRFNKLTKSNYSYEDLHGRYKSCERKYKIVNDIRHHQKFSWDFQSQKVIATNNDWDEYITKHPQAKLFRDEISHFDLLEKVFGDK